MLVITIIAILAILYGIVAFITGLRPGRKSLPGALPAIMAGISILILFSMIVQVGAQEVGILVTPNGVKEEELHTGWHFTWPWNEVEMMDKTEWVYTFATSHHEGSKQQTDAIWAPTKDGIKMGFDLLSPGKLILIMLPGFIPISQTWTVLKTVDTTG